MKTVLDMCPFVGLKYKENGVEHCKGNGLTEAENQRLDSYFAKFYGQRFHREQAIELAQMALDDVPIPQGWTPWPKEMPER
jgi:hypothetical protein